MKSWVHPADLLSPNPLVAAATSAQHLISQSAPDSRVDLTLEGWRPRCRPEGTRLEAFTEDPPLLRGISGLIKKQQSGEGDAQARLAVPSACAFQAAINSLAAFRPLVSKVSSLCLSEKECSWAPPTSNTENSSSCHHLSSEARPYIGRRHPEGLAGVLQQLPGSKPPFTQVPPDMRVRRMPGSHPRSHGKGETHSSGLLKLGHHQPYPGSCRTQVVGDLMPSPASSPGITRSP